MAPLFTNRSIRLLLASMLLGSCISACQSSPSSLSSPSSTASRAPLPAAETTAGNADSAALNQAAPAEQPEQQPQLVKAALLTLTVDAVGPALEKAVAVTRQQQGDLLKLEDQLPDSPGSRHTALLQIRVPQQNLEPALKALAQIGTVQQQTVTAEDVASQLVDHQARLRNLRKTESTLLEIMDRSGSMTDVLKVAQELSNVRSTIEQIDAQLKDLQNRVAYSVVTVQLQQITATLPAEPGVGTQVQETWEQATHSVGRFTVSLMKLGLWLLAYSPYWLVLLLGVIALRRWQPRVNRPADPEPPPTESI